MIDRLGDLFGGGELWVGVVTSAAASAVYLIGARRDVPVVGWGAALAAALVVGMAVVAGLPLLLVAGIAALAAAGRAPTHRGRAVAGLPGAALVAASIRHDAAAWIPWFVAVAVVVVGWALADASRRRHRPGTTGVLLALSAAGVYLTTPDTELARVVLGATVPLALAGLRARTALLAPPGALVIAGLLLWSMATEARGRPPSLLAATGCFGLLLAEPLARAALRRWGREAALPAGRGSRIVATVGHALVVGLVARGPGLWSDPASVAAAVGGMVAALTFFVAVVQLAAGVSEAGGRSPGAAPGRRRRPS